LNYMNIKARLMLGFGITIACIVGVGIIDFSSSQRLATVTDLMDKNGIQALQSLAKMQNAMWELRFGISQYLAVPKPEARQKIIADSPRLFESMDQGLSQFGLIEMSTV